MKEQNYVDNTITTIEMCAGYGGIGLGIKRIFGERLRTIAYCELEGFAQANLISKMEAGLLDAAPLWNDLKTFPYAEFHGLVDILIAGYPCQPFSAAGKRAGKDDPRHLWPWIADGIRLLRPRMCFFENVEGHISLGLSTVISDLEELGYKVSWGIFSASEVGAPHQRKRVFIMAHDSSKGLEGFRTGSHEDTKGWEESDGHAWSSCLRIREQWPSRPGEPQYGWEPPRVVENSKLFGRRGRSDGDAGGLRGEIQAAGSCGSGAEAGMAHTHSCGGEEPEHQQANLPSEPSGGNAEAMGNASQREDHGRESRDMGIAPSQWGCGNDAADCTSEGMANAASAGYSADAGGICSSEGEARRQDVLELEHCGATPWPSRPGEQQFAWEPPRVVGNADPRRLASGLNAGSSQEADRRGEGDIEQAESGQIESNVGLHIDESSFGVGHAELSSLCDSELAEIREWMVKCDNRTDELRLLGNGVVPATAERAFRTLMEELQK